MRLLLYAILSLALVPAFVLGLLCYMVPILWSRGRVSGTTYEPFNARLVYHLLGTRPDAASLRLSAGLPATNLGTMALLVRPLAWLSRVTGYVPDFARYPPPRPCPMSAMIGLRCEFLDQALLDHIADVPQVVILGAGWDTRAYGLLAGRGARCFEVDAPGTQAVKRRALSTTGLDTTGVTFVPCDFNRQSWLDALDTQGFDRSARTFVLWEGVTMYLEADAIASTLEMVATLPAGSRIGFDFFSREFLDSFAGRMGQKSIVATYGEPLTFGFSVGEDPRAALGDVVGRRGLTLERVETFGKGQVPMGGLALAVKP